MQDLRAIRDFQYNGKFYNRGQLFQADDKVAKYLVYRGLAVYVSIAPGTPITTPLQAPMQGETKELKKETVKKEFPVSKRK